MEKKKTEQALKARKEIADYIKNHRVERARIRVEHIVREDYLVEALEVVELYCDLLLARFGLLEQKEYCDDTLAEAVATLIWVAPRLSADIQELTVVSHQLEIKFGKPFAQQARSNLANTVNPKVIHRLGVEPIKKSLTENYLVEIARNYKVEYQPDPTAFLEDDVSLEPPEKLDFNPQDEVKPFNPPPATAPPHTAAQPNHYAGYAAYPGPPPPVVTQGPVAPPPATNPLPYPTGPSGAMPGQQPPELPPPPTGHQDFNLPSVPSNNMPENSASSSSDGGGGGDVDFDDLTRRFEQLKKKK